MLDFAGWIGAVCFAVCGMPQALQSIKQGHSRGLNNIFLACWFFGEIFTIIYVWPKSDFPLLVNYFVNLLFLVIMGYYKFFERVQK